MSSYFFFKQIQITITRDLPAGIWDHVTFDHNTATAVRGGATSISISAYSELLISSCNFTGNYASFYGGAVSDRGVEVGWWGIR